jgi:hypothetical protein
VSLDQENHFSVAEKSADCIWGKESNNDFVSENEVYYFFYEKPFILRRRYRERRQMDRLQYSTYGA